MRTTTLLAGLAALPLLLPAAAAAQELDIAAELAGDREALRTVQEQLNALGFPVGTPDGAFGPRSAAGFLAFRQQFGGEAVLNPAAVEQLEAAVAAREDEPSEQHRADGIDFLRLGPPAFSWDVRDAVAGCEDGSCRANQQVLVHGDLTGDGLEELVVATGMMNAQYDGVDRPGPILIVSPDGKGQFSLVPVTTDQPGGLGRVHARAGVIADFNGDDANDLFVVAHGFDYPPYPGEQNLLLLSGEDGLRDVSTTNLPLQNDFTHGAAEGDLDADGDLDLLVINNKGSTRIDAYVLLNDGTGQFEKAPEGSVVDSALLDFDATTHRPAYTTARIADVDGDRHLDILLLGSGDEDEEADRYKGFRYTRIVYGDGSGYWSAENAVELPSNRWGYSTFTTDAEILDLDEDGDQDIILTTGYNDPSLPNASSWRRQYIQVFSADGRTFTDITPATMFGQGYADLSFATHSHMADLDGDGDQDLVTQNSSPWLLDEGAIPAVMVAFREADGRFSWYDPALSGADGYTGRELVPMDHDGDGDIDIVGMELLGEMTDDDFATYGLKLTPIINGGR